MFAIGDFARLGRVSVRMLRHYDALGLLPPTHVDDATGYRHYTATQLSRLNQIVALKDLGFTLEQVKSLIDEKLDLAELRGMLRLRRTELLTELASGHARLNSVETRLSAIEADGRMPDGEVVIKQIPATQVAELTALANSYQPADISAVIAPLYDELCRRLHKSATTPTGPAVASYEEHRDGILVHAALPVATNPENHDGLTIVELPAIRAATAIHHGAMATVDISSQALGRWIDANGYQATDYAREVNLHCPPDPHQWVTELQEPITNND